MTFWAYQSGYEVARSIGREVSKWEPDESKGWHFDVQQLEATQGSCRYLRGRSCLVKNTFASGMAEKTFPKC